MKAKTKTTLTDNRAAKRLEPQQQHELIARQTVALALLHAKQEAAIQAVREKFARRMEAAQSSLDEAMAALDGWIWANRERFVAPSPRAQRTPYGSFGLRLVSNVAVTDEDRLLATLMDRGYSDAFRTETKVVKPALAKRLRAGEELAGATLEVGELSFVDVDKTYIAQAVEAGSVRPQRVTKIEAI